MSDDTSNADLRRELDECRAARKRAVSRLKRVADKVANGRETPISAKFRRGVIEDEPSAPQSNVRLPATARLLKARARGVEARQARSAGIETFKQKSLSIARVVRQTIRLQDDTDSGGAIEQPA